ncbi:MAG: 4-hydroxy-tetrahydrodipicolinate reductase [Microthrixaceae bacterium]
MGAITVGVLGATGRMGAEVCRAVHADADLELVAAVDPAAAPCDLRDATGVDVDVSVESSIDSMARSDAQVVVDFTTHAASMENLPALADAGIHCVVGTTGFSESDIVSLREAFHTSNALLAPNFAIGAVLMMRFAELAAPWFESAEVIELHHENKIDSPSGTAMRTVERMAEASGQWTPDPTRTETIAGARGSEGPAGIRVHSVRLRGLVAHQEVLLGGEGQTLSIRHDSLDRTSFMAGVVLAAKRVPELPGLTIGLDSLLGL